MIATSCLFCQTPDDHILYPATFHQEHLNARVFSARRNPDGIHYQMIQCRRCGLVRSNPILEKNEMAKLYKQSSCTYDHQIKGLRHTYGTLLRQAQSLTPHHHSLLEIGCGNGFFLETALDSGYHDVWGVEPSEAAVAQVPDPLKSKIRVALFEHSKFPVNTFDTVCLFHVLDHMIQPLEALKLAWNFLKPEGIILCVTHDVSAWSASLFGERSPIIDIEHIYLFDQKTIRRAFEQTGFHVQECRSLANTFPLQYWGALLPLPPPLKRWFIQAMKFTGVHDLEITLKAGNIFLLAKKP